MDRRPANGGRRKQPSISASAVDAATEGRRQLHALSNTLASLRLRLGILAADPTCADAQGENVTALVAIGDEALQLVRALQPSLETLEMAVTNGASARPRTARRTRRA